MIHFGLHAKFMLREQSPCPNTHTCGLGHRACARDRKCTRLSQVLKEHSTFFENRLILQLPKS